MKKKLTYLLFMALSLCCVSYAQTSKDIGEYTMTCGAQAEYNTLFVVFSPKPFTKAVSSDSKELLPREVSFADFQKWLSKNEVKIKI